MTQDDHLVHIRELDPEEIITILQRNHVGRIGFGREGQIEIQPVHYVYSEGWLYGRTSYGHKYEKIGQTAYGWWPVVFEVDEVEDLFSWRSVLVRGGFYLLKREDPASTEAWEEGLRLLRTLLPSTLRVGDPTPHRTALFRIAVQEATGRAATPPEEAE